MSPNYHKMTLKRPKMSIEKMKKKSKFYSNDILATFLYVKKKVVKNT